MSGEGNFTRIGSVSRCDDCGILVAVPVEQHECNPVTAENWQRRKSMAGEDAFIEPEIHSEFEGADWHGVFDEPSSS